MPPLLFVSHYTGSVGSGGFCDRFRLATMVGMVTWVGPWPSLVIEWWIFLYLYVLCSTIFVNC